MSDEDDTTARDGAMEQAAAWFVRLDGGTLSDRERQAFEDWMAAHPGNRRAFEKVSATWDVFGEAAGTRNHSTEAVKRSRPAALRRGMSAAVAAALLLFIGIGSGVPAHLAATLQADAVTAVGETRIVSLPDGSTVTLNTQSALAVDFGPDGKGPRKVRLLRGEAVFDVVANPDRPFLVAAAGGISRVLGTVFSVATFGRETSVALVEGRLAVSKPDGPETILAPNQRVRYGDTTAIGAVETVDPRSIAAWRRGKLAFHDRPLGHVIDELNRYHVGMIRLAGAGIRARRVNGVFDTANPVAVVEALETALGLRSTRLTDYLIVLHE